MARKKMLPPKVKLTVTLEPAVVEAIGLLRDKLEFQAHGGNKSLLALHGPLRYTQSAVVQMGILALCTEHKIVVQWKKR